MSWSLWSYYCQQWKVKSGWPVLFSCIVLEHRMGHRWPCYSEPSHHPTWPQPRDRSPLQSPPLACPAYMYHHRLHSVCIQPQINIPNTIDINQFLIGYTSIGLEMNPHGDIWHHSYKKFFYVSKSNISWITKCVFILLKVMNVFLTFVCMEIVECIFTISFCDANYKKYYFFSFLIAIFRCHA